MPLFSNSSGGFYHVIGDWLMIGMAPVLTIESETEYVHSMAPSWCARFIFCGTRADGVAQKTPGHNDCGNRAVVANLGSLA